jgi:Fe2+ transport system protein B
MDRLFGPSKWWWLAPLVFLIFLVLALLQGSTLPALGWVCFLVNGILVASGVHTRSRVLSGLALAFALLGILLLGASVVRDFFL